MNKPRNPVARSPLLRKGGAHGKSKSAERSGEKRALKKELSQYKKGASWSPSSLWVFGILYLPVRPEPIEGFAIL